MFDPMQDESDIRSARSAYNARKTDSALVSWICSEDWTRVVPTHPKDRERRGHVDSGRHGIRRYDMCEGEIEQVDPTGLRKIIADNDARPWGEILDEVGA